MQRIHKEEISRRIRAIASFHKAAADVLWGGKGLDSKKFEVFENAAKRPTLTAYKYILADTLEEFEGYPELFLSQISERADSAYGADLRFLKFR
tara:strand:+ start:800 stop:1081 length:282 start_codon:yes stop_codon:yes gene_type:complete